MFYLLQTLCLAPCICFLAYHDARTQRLPLGSNLFTLLLAAIFAGTGIAIDRVSAGEVVTSVLLMTFVLGLGVVWGQMGKGDLILGTAIALWMGCYGCLYTFLALLVALGASLISMRGKNGERFAFGPGLAVGVWATLLLRLFSGEVKVR